MDKRWGREETEELKRMDETRNTESKRDLRKRGWEGKKLAGKEKGKEDRHAGKAATHT